MKRIPIALFLILLGIGSIAIFKTHFTNAVNQFPELEEEEKSPNDWLYNQRAYPHNHIDYQAYRDGVAQTKLAKQEASITRSSEPWELAGPVNTGGRITDVALDPSDINTFYVGASVGGIFKTTDGGTSWDAIFEDEGVLTIGNIAIAPSEPQTLYVGTGEANGSATSGAFFGNGVYKTTDGGDNWEHVGLENTQHIGRVVVDPNDANKVFVAAAGLLYGKSEDKGLYKTLDGGQNWTQVLFVSDSTSCIDVAINPENPDILYAATWERIRMPWQRRYGGPTSRVYRSTDGGDTWEQLTNGLPASDGQTGRIGLAISSSNPDVVFATYTTNFITNVFDGIYKSLDGGDSWFQVDDGSINNLYASFGWFFGNIRVDPNDEEIVYALGVPLYKSIDGGQSWSQITPAHVDQHGLEVHPTNSNFVVAGNDGGVFISQNGGGSWEHIEVLPITQFYECEIDPVQPDRVYGGTQDNGTNRTLTGAIDDWERVLGGDGFHVIINPEDNNIFYAETQWGNLFRSLDGETMEFSFGADEEDRTNWNTPVVMDPSNPNTLYYGANILYRTINGGDSWELFSEDLTNGEHPSGSQSFGTITSIAVAPNNSQVIYVGTDDGNIQVTFDEGDTWNNISEGVPDRYITEVAVDYANENIAYATLSGYKYVDYQPHVLRTEDGGQSWQDISGNLPEIPVNDIIIHPDYENFLIIANDLGVWYTIDLGETWEVLGENLPMTVVNDLDYHPETQKLVAATYGRSMHKLDLAGLNALEELPTEIGDYQLKVSPNPIQHHAKIEFQIPEKGIIRIEVFNLNGQKITSLANEDFEKGKHEISWDAGELASGTYVVRIYSEKKILTEKVVKQ